MRDHNYFDICPPKGSAYPGLVTATAAWKAGKTFVALTGNHVGVTRTEQFLSKLKSDGYEGIRLFLGHNFHLIESL